MLPTVEILGLSIRLFGVMIVVALVVALIMLVRRAHELGAPERWATEGAFVAIAGALAGARIYYVLKNGGDVSLTGGGLVYFGGVLGAALAVLVWGRLRGVPLRLADSAAPVAAAVYAILRIGCQLAGDGDYGRPSDLPWAMGYPDGTLPTPPGVEVHPTPVYETLASGLAAVWLWRRRDAYRPGVLTAVWLLFAGAERFLVELVRRNPDVAVGLTSPQLQSLVLVAAGGGLLAHLAFARGPTEKKPAA
ncbi:MAG TPA: prolipoprotein diacylglyceryl transferase family protein [Solirubrobacteraceae bacterium]|jgi:phosphatidylglycerol:prolipoprotein diacylglycerol transferase